MQMLPHLEAPSEREFRWRHGGVCVSAQVAGPLVADLTQLGRLDCSLKTAATEVEGALTAGKVGGPAPMGVFDYFFLSKLWVFSAYEIARVIRYRLKASHPCFPRAKALFEKLERVRVPLAKLESPRKNPDDHAFTKSLSHGPAVGVSWQVNNLEFVNRHALADEFLELLDSFPEPRVITPE
jgi:hypothetical protein